MLDRLIAGEIARKHHTALRDASGALRYEECLTRQGFEGPYTILYHRERPHDLHACPTTHGWQAELLRRDPALSRRHYRTSALDTTAHLNASKRSTAGSAASPVDARIPLLFNQDVVISALCPQASDPIYFSNADGDDLFFIREGGGILVSAFGELRFSKGDYVAIPKGVVHRFKLPDNTPQAWLSLECRSNLGLLKQARNEVGQLRMDAPYSHRDFERPHFVGPFDEGIRHSVVKRGDRFHGFEHHHTPFDVVGFDGTVYPWAFAIDKFQPRVASVHLPPIWHGTFQSRGILICSFVPRLLDFGRDAVTCPYPHSSVDVDEVIYYVSGDFISRRGIEAGSITHHPAGVAHGPHPGAYEASIGATKTEELAVMLDCYSTLHATEAASTVEDASYDASFRAQT